MSEKRFTMRLPLFGLCHLVPHSPDEEPTCLVGYVALEGQENTPIVAIRQKGEWCGRSLKPISQPISTWYSVEKADGTRVF